MGSGTSGDAPCCVLALPERGQLLLPPQGDPPARAVQGCAAAVAPLGWGHGQALRLLREV